MQTSHIRTGQLIAKIDKIVTTIPRCCRRQHRSSGFAVLYTVTTARYTAGSEKLQQCTFFWRGRRLSFVCSVWLALATLCLQQMLASHRVDDHVRRPRQVPEVDVELADVAELVYVAAVCACDQQGTRL